MADAAALDVNSEHHQASESLHVTLDNLWSQYLSLLDQYQNLRQLLANDLSNVK